MRGVFIRAPRIVDAGPEVESWGAWRASRCSSAEGRVLAASFHPELTDDTRVHERFLERGERNDMSGHSKWSSIKHKKGAADAKRGQLFSKLTRAIIVAAREGRPDPTGTPPSPPRSRRHATTRCRRTTSSAPSPAARRGCGGESYETVTYEGYGDGGVAVFVEALTDNRNRTAAEIRIFAKHDGNLGTSGAVAWLFERASSSSRARSTRTS